MLSLVVLVSLLSSSSLACVKTARSGGTAAGSAVLRVFDRPPNLPPTPAPTPPPPPPPFAVGWVPSPPRKQAINAMTRQNCVKSVEFVPPEGSNGDRDLLQEKFIYTCKYQMYIEVDLFDTESKTGCACGLSWGRQTPPQDPNYEPSFATHIDRFSLQVYNTQTQRPIEEIPGFSNLQPNSQATDDLSSLLNSALQSSLREEDAGSMKVGDFANARKVFTGFVNNSQTGQGFTRESVATLRDSPANQYNVPVMCFEVVDVYKTAYRWPEPPVPVLFAPPNAYVTNCVPFVPRRFEGGVPVPISARKRWHDDTDPLYAGVSYWIRDFLLFSVQQGSGASMGGGPKSRYMTAYYASSDCSMLAGVVTFQREFVTTSITRNPDLFGGFTWHRTFVANGASLVGGVPQKVLQNRFARNGHHTVAWRENFARRLDSAGNGQYRPALLFHMLNGTFTNQDKPAAAETFEQLFGGLPAGWEYTPGEVAQGKVVALPHRYKLCERVPDEWRTAQSLCTKAQAVGGSNCPYDDDQTYLESSINFLARSPALACAEQGAFQMCADDVTFLSFQNFGTGALSRDFSKKSTSYLLTGPRELFCTDITRANPPATSFDAMSYQAILATDELKKRAVRTDDFLTEEQLSAPRPTSMHFKRETVSYDLKPSAPLYGEPEDEALIINAAGGSFDVDANRAGGAHPIALFEETYTVPLSLNPDDLEYAGHQDGYLFDNTFTACLQGTKGCNCRDREGRRACDAPLVCDREENAGGYCVDPPCERGQAGCGCFADATCASNRADLTCNVKTNTCVLADACPAGKLGCLCRPASAGKQCDAGSCDNKFCVADDCVPGLPGCACNTDVDQGPECFAKESSCLKSVSPAICVGGNILDKTSGETTPVAQLKHLGAVCSTDADCSGAAGATCNTAAGGYCTRPRCTPGATGCSCATGACTSAKDFCDESTGVCLTSSCEHGSRGCLCLSGYSCAAGFECVDTLTNERTLKPLSNSFTGARVDRCVATRCPRGGNGCACDDECANRGFECKLMSRATSEKRCVATGRECGSQTARCTAYCGVGNVVRCPGCSDQIPSCKFVRGSASGVLAPIASLLALLALAMSMW